MSGKFSSFGLLPDLLPDFFFLGGGGCIILNIIISPAVCPSSKLLYLVSVMN